VEVLFFLSFDSIHEFWQPRIKLNMNCGTVACLVLSDAAGRVTLKHCSPDLAAFHSRIKAGTILVTAKSVHVCLTAFFHTGD